MRKRVVGLAACFAVAAMLSCCFTADALTAPKTLAHSSSQLSSAPSPVSSADRRYISKKAARKIAFEDAGVKKKKCTHVTVQLRPKGGAKVYLVAFTFKKKLRYNYTLNAHDGAIIAYYTKCV